MRAEREEHGALRPDAVGQRSKENREGYADELHHDEGTDLRALPDADLFGVDRCHADDGLDAVVVEEKRHEHQKCLPVGAKLVERLPHPAERNAQRLLAARLVGLEDGGWLGDTSEQRQREQEPPHRDAHERHLDPRYRVLESKRLRRHDERKVEREQDAAAEEADGVSGRRHAVDLVWSGNVREQ
jgi:hypothetical protein